MKAEQQMPTSMPIEFNYHLLRNALNRFSRNLQQLNADEYRLVEASAHKSFSLESRVLASDEAAAMVISSQQLDQAMAELRSRYADQDEFLLDLAANGLDEAGMRSAIYRELAFDSVMQKVAAKSADISEIDMRLFYEMHRERFETPETRVASHILITVNSDYAENTREAALAQIQQIADKLGGRSNRFAQFAKRYSECPTAMDGGKLGEVAKGQLYIELDAMLFGMQEQQISPVVESEMGFHLLFCEKIKPAKRMPYAKAQPRIREILEQRRRRNCQKNWLASLPDVGRNQP
ncbi:MAG: nitrogen fixation protein NifM [Chromatiales bacterium]|jgi:peptidyl-prolyl cis-trans isomerase C